MIHERKCLHFLAFRVDEIQMIIYYISVLQTINFILRIRNKDYGT